MSATLEEALIGNYGSDFLPNLQNIKQEAKSAFIKNGLPKFREEEYKFTPIAKTLEKNFSFKNQVSQEIGLPDLAGQLIEDSAVNQIIFVNGVYSSTLSKFEQTDGLIIKSLKQAAVDHADNVEKYFGKLSDVTIDSFAALNTALTQDGIYIEVLKNTNLATPFYIYYVNTAQNAETHSFPRNLIIANSNSKITLVEKAITLGNNNAFLNVMAEVVVHENAHVHQVRLQNDRNNAYEVTQTQVNQTSNSNYSAYTISLSGGMIRNNLNITSDGQNCESNMYGLYLLNEKTHVDNHTVVDHKQPNSYSNELYKGVLDDKSKGVFNGKIFVRQEAQKTNAFQSNNNILLSDSATLNTKPQLEIWADDVKCSHGCTSGQLDKEAIFYLQARGISKQKAIGMLLYAFANDVVDKIPVEGIKTYLDNIVSRRLNS